MQQPSPMGESTARILKLDAAIKQALIKWQKSDGSKKSRLEYIRKRNSLYSQRKYHKKLLTIKQLRKEKRGLVKANSLIEEENTHLEAMLANAKDLILLNERLDQRRKESELVAKAQREGLLKTLCTPGLLQSSLVAQGIGTRAPLSSMMHPIAPQDVLSRVNLLQLESLSRVALPMDPVVVPSAHLDLQLARLALLGGSLGMSR